MLELSNKTVWMYWGQGWDNAPHLVKRCRQSWETLNQGYQIIALDSHSVNEYLDIPSSIGVDRSDISIATVSDFIRIGLLAKHGGVWVDATAMCAEPLDDWLPEYFSSGFFAFRNPGKDRLFSSWFLVAEPENILAAKIYKEFCEFLSSNSFPNQYNVTGKIFRSIFKIRWNRNTATTIGWHSELAQKTLKTYPYFIFHYIFNKIILENEELRQIWESSKPFEARLPHQIQFFSRQLHNIEKAESFILSRQAPVHKLNRRRNTDSKYWAAILNTFETTNNQYKLHTHDGDKI